MQKFLESILNQCLDILESDNGSILLTDRNNRDIVVRVARGKHKTPILGERIRLGEGISGLVAQQKKPLLVEDVTKEQEIKLRCRMDNYRTNSFLSVPLVDNGKLLGVINITEKVNGKPFTIKELAFVSAITTCAANTINRILYAEHLERQLECFKNSTAVARFTSAVAHELNNPLDGVMRYVQLCMHHVSELGIAREYLREIKSGLKRMSAIVSSMLEFSFAGQRNSSPLDREEVNVNDVLSKTVSFFQEQAQWKQITIETSFKDDLPRIKDCGLEQVFVNLIKNSLEAIDHNGKIVIRDYKSNGHLCIDFIDTGRGIEEELGDKVFEPFFSTKPGGKGLGLAIVKEIIDCYDGQIKMERISQGGVKFTVLIPIGGKK